MPFANRRAVLHRMLGQDDGVILWLGSELQARNYPDNPYMPFRQNSHFLYYAGVSAPGYALLSYPDGREVLFGPSAGLDEIVWTGPQPTLEERAQQAQVRDWQPREALSGVVGQLESVLYLPPYQEQGLLALAKLLRCKPHEVAIDSSKALMQAVCSQRSKKTPEEIEQIEDALGFTQQLFHASMGQTKAGLTTSQLYGFLCERVYSQNRDFSFPPIITTHGEILHNHHYGERLNDGRLLLMDMGTETSTGYASDITRVWPVNGKFSSQQRDVYEVVLSAQLEAIKAIRPGVHYRDVHLIAARVIAEGMRSLGLLKGDPQEAVAEGAHALFFPHGLGHMMGIDVHDMEDLGDVVGYGEEGLRSGQFGLNFLRLARPLQEGFVLTVEPGVYFIPTLIDMWHKEGRFAQWICYDKLPAFRTFGGIRIEDNVLVTAQGSKVLGPAIAKSCKEVEDKMRGSL